MSKLFNCPFLLFRELYVWNQIVALVTTVAVGTTKVQQ